MQSELFGEVLSSQGPHGTERSDHKHFLARQVLDVSEQGSKFPKFFGNTFNNN